MKYKIEDIEGIGSGYAEKLRAAGIYTTADLLANAATPRGREQLADTTGIPEKLILKWANHADLFRIPGIAGQYSELLEAAGVDTVKELRHRRADNLYHRMEEVNNARNLSGRVPSEKELERMIAEAAKLDPVLTY